MSDYSDVTFVAWDLDGTLIDSFGVYLAIITEACQLSGLPVPTEDTIRHNFHGSLDQTIKDSTGLVDGAALTTLLNDFLRVQEDYYKHPEEHVHPDALSLMKHFGEQGCTQVVVTNRAHEGRGNASPRYLVEHSSLREYVSDIVCGDEAEFVKPHRAVLANVLSAQGLAGEQMLVVGDQFVDAQLAQNLGARAIIVNRSDGQVPHLDKLGDDHSFLQIVNSLDVESVYTNSNQGVNYASPPRQQP